jgi:hypothetical protein
LIRRGLSSYNKYKIGVVAEDFKIQTMVRILQNLNAEQIKTYKSNSDKAAKELCFENESMALKEIITDLIRIDKINV